MIVYQKAKPLGGKKWGTRKSKNCLIWNIILPRADWIWYRQVDSNRSKRRKHLRKLSNKKIRNYKWDIQWWGNYKKIFDLPRILD
jgi:hypothetical protein